LLSISIVMSHAWALMWASLLVRVGTIVLAVSWIVIVDPLCTKSRLVRQLFSAEKTTMSNKIHARNTYVFLISNFNESSVHAMKRQ